MEGDMHAVCVAAHNLQFCVFIGTSNLYFTTSLLLQRFALNKSQLIGRMLACSLLIAPMPHIFNTSFTHLLALWQCTSSL